MTDEERIVYSNRYTDWSRESILTELRTKIKASRFEHVLRVEACALKLADKYGADREACSIAAVLHDYAKDIPRDHIVALVDKGLLQSELLAYGSQIWHGPASAHFAEQTFGITDQTILEAVSQHTIGGKEMSLVSKVLYIADYVEDGRVFPGVDEVRKLAFEDLDQAVIYKITHTLVYLIQKGVVVYPETLFVYNSWIKNRGKYQIE